MERPIVVPSGPDGDTIRRSQGLVYAFPLDSTNDSFAATLPARIGLLSTNSRSLQCEVREYEFERTRKDRVAIVDDKIGKDAISGIHAPSEAPRGGHFASASRYKDPCK